MFGDMSRWQAEWDARVLRGSDEDCWLWTGSINGSGYGQLELVIDGERNHRLAHRLSYQLVHAGESPEQVHHRCNIKACVNPAHLVGMTLAEHQAEHHVKVKCANGHSYLDPANVYSRPGKPRQCRACNRERQQRYRSVQRSLALP